VVQEGQYRRVFVDSDPGLTQEDGMWFLDYSPRNRAKTVKAGFRYSHTTVPTVRFENTRKPYYWINQENDFEYRDTAGTYEVKLTSTVKDAPVYYTTDGSTPSAKSLTSTGTLQLSGDKTINAIALNPKGVMSSRINFQRYVPRLPVAQVAGQNLAQGLRWSSYDIGGRYGEWTFENIGLKGLTPVETGVVNRVDRGTWGIDDNILYGSMHPIKERWQAVQFEGYIKVPADGVYTFATGHSGMLYIDGIEVINSFGLNGLTLWQGEISLEKGVHRIVMKYHGYANHREHTTAFKGPGFDWKKIPNDILFYEKK